MPTNITNNKFHQTFAYLFLACWSVLLLANFVPAIPQPSSIIGYLWKVEFALAGFLLIAIVSIFKLSGKFFIRFSRNEFTWIILPLLLFTVWSGFSVFWAESARSALHHTLLWACYAVFYLLIRQIVAKPQFLNLAMKVIGIVIAILSIVCLTEYLTTAAEMSGNVSLRYSKYAEAIATLFVLFVTFAVQKQNRHSILFAAIALIGWLAIVFSLGRTQFLAGFCGIFVFAVFTLTKSRSGISLKKSVVFVIVFVLITVFSQISFTEKSQQTTLKRLSGDDQAQTSFQVRVLLWQIAFESFKQNPLSGIGAENFASNYKEVRKNYAEINPNDNNLALYEDILPERTHNEFLQILAELGIVGFGIFGWLLFGILRLAFSMQKEKVSLLSIAAFSGICAFLISSLASSYSFRVPANGLCFFFVLALLVSGKRRAENQTDEKKYPQFLAFHSPILAAGLTVCVAMLAFSVVRGVSLMYMQFALTSADTATGETYFQKSLALDSENSVCKYYYGLHFYKNAQAFEAIPQIRFSIDKGFSTSVAYFNLASMQIIAKKPLEAELTLVESLKVYPRSVFLQTAYASILEDNGKPLEAQNEYEKASNINAEQARSWRIAFAKGMKNLSQTKGQDNQYVAAMELRPTEGIYALLDFQRQFRPELVERAFSISNPNP